MTAATAPLPFRRSGGQHRFHESWGDDPGLEVEPRPTHPSRALDPEWVDKLNSAVRDMSRELALAFRINQLEAAIERVEIQASSSRAVIQTLTPWPLRLRRALEVTLQPEEDYWIASEFDANLHASGDTETEAIDNLKATLVEEFEILSGIPSSRLGPEMLRQLKVLSELVELPHESDEG